MSVNRASFPSHDTLLAIIHFTRDYWFDGLPPSEALLLLAIVMLISVSFPSQVFTLLIGSMVVAQLLLVYWRKRHYRTYQQVLLRSSWHFVFLITFWYGLAGSARYFDSVFGS